MKRTAFVLALALLALLIGGSVQLLGPPPGILGNDSSSWSPPIHDFVLYQLRLPRLLIAFFVGSTLALVGAAFQSLFRNPLATPSTVGTTAGASLGALFALVLGLRGAGALPAAALFAFIGAFLASSLVLSVAQNARAKVEEILLAGIAITLAAGALSQGLHAISDAETLFMAAQWSLGQLPQVGYDRLLFLVIPAIISALVIFSQGRALSVLALGEDWAQSVGVETRRVRLLTLIGGCLGVATSVALCGPIAFVGLIVPHLVRLGLAGHRAPLLWLSALSGGAFLVLCDAVAKSLPLSRELPVGVITASLGAPALFLLVIRRQGS